MLDHMSNHLRGKVEKLELRLGRHDRWRDLSCEYFARTVRFQEMDFDLVLKDNGFMLCRHERIEFCLAFQSTADAITVSDGMPEMSRDGATC
jgi:hypothetical protein